MSQHVEISKVLSTVAPTDCEETNPSTPRSSDGSTVSVDTSGLVWTSWCSWCVRERHRVKKYVDDSGWRLEVVEGVPEQEIAGVKGR